MTLPSGVITSSDLNSEFGSTFSSTLASTTTVGRSYQYEIDVLDPSSATSVGNRTLDFEAPDDLEIAYLGLQVFSPDATSRTFTLTITAVSVSTAGVATTSVTVFNDQTLSLSTTTSAGPAESTTLSSLVGQNYRLLAGVAYRLQLTMSSASAADRVVGILSVVSNRRRG